jgi:ABC-type uncharacterized transport system substrate-binding protein
MDRRAFIAMVGGSVLAAPLSAEAQKAKVPTIGVLVVGAPSSEKFWRILQDAMRELGYVKGQTVHFEFRSDQGHLDRLPELATELVRLKVDVIVPYFTPAARAAKQATRDIPIVATAGDFVATGLVESLARPGGNITGVSAAVSDLAGKCVELIRDMLPSARRVAALANAPDPFSKTFLEKIRLASEATRLTIEPIMIRGSDEFESAFLGMLKRRPDAVIVQPSLPIKRAAELTLKYRMPGASPFRPFAEEGGLMSYYMAEAEVYRRMAVLVA